MQIDPAPAPSMYCRTTDRLKISRMSYAEWQESHRQVL
jgi:hypothetical protein